MSARTHAHTHTHARTHARTHACTHTRATRSHVFVFRCSLRYRSRTTLIALRAAWAALSSLGPSWNRFGRQAGPQNDWGQTGATWLPRPSQTTQNQSLKKTHPKHCFFFHETSCPCSYGHENLSFSLSMEPDGPQLA